MIILEKIKDKIHNVKMFIQRGKKGYCDEDLWEMDHWFSKLLPRMLEEFKTKNLGIPSYLNRAVINDKVVDVDYKLDDCGGQLSTEQMDKVYQDDIQYMIDKCKLYDNDDYYTKDNLTTEQLKQLSEEQLDKFKSAIHLFAELAPHLWW